MAPERKITDGKRMIEAIHGIEGKCLMYQATDNVA
jgi:hypothetical protein